MVHQSTSLQLHIELEINGLEIVDRSSTTDASYASILEELKSYRDAWLNFNLAPRFIQRISGISYPKFHNNVYFTGCDHSVVDDGRLELFDLIHTAKFYSSVTPPPLTFKKIFNEFAVDTKQDLIVLVQYNRERFFAQVHFHHIITRNPHPLAHFPTLTVRFKHSTDENHSRGFVFTRPILMQDILVIQFRAPIESSTRCDDILIWNWQSGCFLGRIHSATDGGLPVFLDKTHLLLYATLSDPCVEPYPTKPDKVALLVYRVSNTATPGYPEPPNAEFYAPS